ncbi:MAG: hypothetical protein H6Q52_1028 [Deltaproteobacteria bacterium]|nr:hypothetical protein [Deltaproteobacteria bacterium]
MTRGQIFIIEFLIMVHLTGPAKTHCRELSWKSLGAAPVESDLTSQIHVPAGLIFEKGHREAVHERHVCDVLAFQSSHDIIFIHASFEI